MRNPIFLTLSSAASRGGVGRREGSAVTIFRNSSRETPFRSKRMLDVWRRLGLQDSNRPRTWWNPPDDRFLIANPQPSWPCASTKTTGLQEQPKGAGVVAEQELTRAR